MGTLGASQIQYTNIWGNSDCTWEDGLGEYYPGYFNRSTDPLFVSGTYNLRWDSPLLDAGDPSEDYFDQDHTFSDIGWKEIFDPLNLTEVADFTQMERGLYYSTDDVSADLGFSLPSGSIVLLGSCASLTIDATNETVKLGDELDTERTVVSFYNPVEDQEHDPPDPTRSFFKILGDEEFIPPENDVVEINHLAYVHSNSTLDISKVELNINYLDFCTYPEGDDQTMTGRFLVGQGCTGHINNSIFRGSEVSTQMTLLDCDVKMTSCYLSDYYMHGIFMVDYGHEADYLLENINLEGLNSHTGIVAIRSGFRLEESTIRNHNHYALHGAFSWFDMHEIAHNLIYYNSRIAPNNGQIYLYDTNCQLECGYNKIAYDDDNSNITLIREPYGEPASSVNVTYNDWGDEVEDPTPLLPPSWGLLIYEPLYNWGDPLPESCGGDSGAGQMFAQGQWSETNGDLQVAIDTYKDIVLNFPLDPYSTRATFRLNYISKKGYEEAMTIKDGFLEALDAIGGENHDLTYFLEGSYWELYGRLVHLEDAIANLETLRDQASEDDAGTFFELCIAKLNSWNDMAWSYSEGDPEQTCERIQAEFARQNDYLDRVMEICGVEFGSQPANNDDLDHLLPASFTLSQNYPNPFNPLTTISYIVPVQCDLELAVYNSLGQKVKCLVHELHQPGEYSIQFNGDEFSSGVYFYRLKTEQVIHTRKMILLK